MVKDIQKSRIRCKSGDNTIDDNGPSRKAAAVNLESIRGLVGVAVNLGADTSVAVEFKLASLPQGRLRGTLCRGHPFIRNAQRCSCGDSTRRKCVPVAQMNERYGDRYGIGPRIYHAGDRRTGSCDCIPVQGLRIALIYTSYGKRVDSLNAILVADNACHAGAAALVRRSVSVEQYIRGQSARVGARGELSHCGRDHGTAEPGHNDQ
jgi:hypothetical protein